MMAIEIVGGVYCPLSPRDPCHRLCQLIEQTKTCLVAVHSLTKKKFINGAVLFDLDLVLINHFLGSICNVNGLSDVVTIDDNIAYVIFTSGSTGSPKTVSSLD